MIVVVALLVFGPDRLPKVAADAARMLRQVRLMAASARKDLVDAAGLEDDGEMSQTLRDLRDLDPRRAMQGALSDDPLPAGPASTERPGPGAQGSKAGPAPGGRAAAGTGPVSGGGPVSGTGRFVAEPTQLRPRVSIRWRHPWWPPRRPIPTGPEPRTAVGSGREARCARRARIAHVPRRGLTEPDGAPAALQSALPASADSSVRWLPRALQPAPSRPGRRVRRRPVPCCSRPTTTSSRRGLRVPGRRAGGGR